MSLPFFLLKLGADIKSIDLSVEASPQGPVREIDYRVGVLSEPLRRLWVLCQLFSRECERVSCEMVMVAFAHKTEEQARLQAHLLQLEETLTTLRQIFFLSVKIEFPVLFRHSCVSVRKGWEVVWVDNRE
jgi:hypothetical protein